MRSTGRRSTGPAGRRAGGSQRRAAGASRRAVSATRRPSRAGASRPVTGRPANAPAAASSSARRSTRSVAPRAGQRRRAAAVVLSPLARQIAALGLALCAVALSLAYPLRDYLQQQAAERAAVAEQHELEEQIADLKAQQAALQDPAYIKAQAKRRLQYVSPGDTVYVVTLPGRTADELDSALPGGVPTGPSAPAGDSASTPGSASVPEGGASTDRVGGGDTGDGDPAWYASLWNTLTGDGDAALAPDQAP